MSADDRVHLVLADGTAFAGRAFGHRDGAVGEAVFTTTMTGYQEVLTDPSYCGQLVVMTAPQIGNVGINAEDCESVDGRPHVAGFVIRDVSPIASSWRSEETLEAYLVRHRVVGIRDVDTRRLVRHLRDRGAQNGAIGPGPVAELAARAAAAPDMNGLDLASRVTTREPYAWTEGRAGWAPSAHHAPHATQAPEALHVTSGARPREGAAPHVVVIDFGIKRNILRCLVDAGCRVTAVPAAATAADVLALRPDGVFLSNGPGDPAAVGYGIATVKDLLGKKPIFGICLGHQLLAHALGGATYKLKFGHRGANQPVKDLATGRVEITTQNHGFCVDLASLPKSVLSTHVHLNDGTSEGLAAPELRAFSVQYHPEAAAGPHDSLYLFDRFMRWMAPS